MACEDKEPPFSTMEAGVPEVTARPGRARKARDKRAQKFRKLEAEEQVPGEERSRSCEYAHSISAVAGLLCGATFMLAVAALSKHEMSLPPSPSSTMDSAAAPPQLSLHPRESPPPSPPPPRRKKPLCPPQRPPSPPSPSAPSPPPLPSPPLPPTPAMCVHRHVLPRHVNVCQRYVDERGYTIVHDCTHVRSCDRANSKEFGRLCGEHLLPADDSFTAFIICGNHCELEARLECPPRREVDMLETQQISRASWDSYVLKLYDAASSELPLLPRFDRVDMVYTRLLPLQVVEVETYDNCPRSATHIPFTLPEPHVRVAAYFNLAEAPIPAADNAWVEITHCGSRLEEESSWFYVLRGSAIYVNVGKTIWFKDHPEAAEHFGIHGDVTNVPAAAREAGYDSIQYLEHCEGCRCSYELMLTKATGTGSCPDGLEFRTGANASKPCLCQPRDIGSGNSQGCITCSSFSDML
ncbi:hypothetical protein AB1Y20_010160 [Prymnesium parvum]|uniref:Uncharacterized protein n=1 Tax=Prymnesium parvum TaxID=97485 RepID=A0AB34K6D0_PRYPA